MASGSNNITQSSSSSSQLDSSYEGIQESLDSDSCEQWTSLDPKKTNKYLITKKKEVEDIADFQASSVKHEKKLSAREIRKMNKIKNAEEANHALFRFKSSETSVDEKVSAFHVLEHLSYKKGKQIPTRKSASNKVSYEFGKDKLIVHKLILSTEEFKKEIIKELAIPTTEEDSEDNFCKMDFTRGTGTKTKHSINGELVSDFEAFKAKMGNHYSTISQIVGQKIFAIMSDIAIKTNGEESSNYNCNATAYTVYNHAIISDKHIEISVSMTKDVNIDIQKNPDRKQDYIETLQMNKLSSPYVCYEAAIVINNGNVKITYAHIFYTIQD